MATGHLEGNASFTGAISVMAMGNCTFANFAEAMAEGPQQKRRLTACVAMKKKTSFARRGYVHHGMTLRLTMSRPLT